MTRSPPAPRGVRAQSGYHRTVSSEPLALPWEAADQAALEPLEMARRRPTGQMLKWIGNKQRSAEEIAEYLPTDYRRYFEPFVGGGALLGTLLQMTPSQVTS